MRVTLGDRKMIAMWLDLGAIPAERSTREAAARILGRVLAAHDAAIAAQIERTQ